MEVLGTEFIVKTRGQKLFYKDLLLVNKWG
jgi:hypothetical protein